MSSEYNQGSRLIPQNANQQILTRLDSLYVLNTRVHMAFPVQGCFQLNSCPIYDKEQMRKYPDNLCYAHWNGRAPG